MNFIRCRKCGTNLMSIDSRLNDLHEYRQELIKEREKIRGKENSRARIKQINVELTTLESQIAREKRIVHIENKVKDRNSILVDVLKEYVNREQFIEAVEKANVISKGYEKILKEEKNRLYGYTKEVNENRSNRNAYGYVDKTASEAINNVSKKQ